MHPGGLGGSLMAVIGRVDEVDITSAQAPFPCQARMMEANSSNHFPAKTGKDFVGVTIMLMAAARRGFCFSYAQDPLLNEHPLEGNVNEAASF